MQCSLRVRLQFRLACWKCGRPGFNLAYSDPAYITLCIETDPTKVADKEDCAYTLLVIVPMEIADQNPKYISEYGFSEPFEGQRTDLFRILDDTDRTSTLFNLRINCWRQSH